MEVSTRQASQADFEWLYELKVASRRRYIEAVYGWDDDAQRKFFKDDFRPQGIEIITADGSDAGMFKVTQDKEGFFLERIEIHPKFQSRGVGSRIVQGILDEPLEKNKSVNLFVFKVNPARNLYERLGFRIVEETETHYRMISKADDLRG